MGGRHRAPSTLKPRLVKLGSITLVISGTSLFNGTDASAAPTSSAILEVIAGCESGNRNIATGLGSTASGYLQILDSTWRAFGGKEFASRALHASREEQFIVGQRILAGQGISAWDPSRSCWGKKTAIPAVIKPTQKPAPAPAPASHPKPAPTAKKRIVTSAPKIVKKQLVAPPKDTAQRVAKTYLIKRGDTLTRIARKNGTSVSALFQANRDTIRNPDLIFAGHHLRLR